MDSIRYAGGVHHAPWLEIMLALGGSLPGDLWREGSTNNYSYETGEAWKALAGRAHAGLRGAINAKARAPYHLLIAFSHWNRAYSLVQSWPKHVKDRDFPDNLAFREYLKAWLHSYAPTIEMDGDDIRADIRAISKLVGGIEPAPHPLLKKGEHDFQKP
jgi:hypothetical protein